MRILLIRDTPVDVRPLACRLREAEFTVVTTVAAGHESNVDAIVLDITRPAPSGYEALRRLRTQDVWLPLLILAPQRGGYDEADALAMGADDYVLKPYRFASVVRRLRALARRGTSQRPAVLRVGTLSLDPVERVVSRDGHRIALSRLEFGVLEHLMRRNGAIATRSEILESVWDQPFHGAKNIVDVCVHNLRRKIDLAFGAETIDAASQTGYRLLS